MVLNHALRARDGRACGLFGGVPCCQCARQGYHGEGSSQQGGARSKHAAAACPYGCSWTGAADGWGRGDIIFEVGFLRLGLPTVSCWRIGKPLPMPSQPRLILPLCRYQREFNRSYGGGSELTQALAAFSANARRVAKQIHSGSGSGIEYALNEMSDGIKAPPVTASGVASCRISARTAPLGPPSDLPSPHASLQWRPRTGHRASRSKQDA